MCTNGRCTPTVLDLLSRRKHGNTRDRLRPPRRSRGRNVGRTRSPPSRTRSSAAHGRWSQTSGSRRRVPVLVHDGVIRSGLRRRAIDAMRAAEAPRLAAHALAELYDKLGADFDLQPRRQGSRGGAADDRGRDPPRGGRPACGCATSAGHVKQWQPFAGDARLVVSTSLRGNGRIMLESASTRR